MAATVREEDIQAAIMDALRRRGYTVKQTSEHRRRIQCLECGKWFTPDNGRGCDAGVPDLLVSHVSWPPYLWLGMEVKTESGRLSPAQQELEREHRIVVVRGVEDALGALAKVVF